MDSANPIKCWHGLSLLNPDLPYNAITGSNAAADVPVFNIDDPIIVNTPLVVAVNLIVSNVLNSLFGHVKDSSPWFVLCQHDHKCGWKVPSFKASDHVEYFTLR